MKKINNNFNTNAVKWIIISLIVVIIYSIIDIKEIGSKKLVFSDFLNMVSNGEVQEISIRGNNISGVSLNGDAFFTLAPKIYPQMIDDLRSHNVTINVMPIESALGNVVGMLLSWFPMILLIGVWLYFMKNIQGAGGKAMSFGNSKAKLMPDSGKKITFSDVAGVDEAKEELKEIVDFLKDPLKFSKLGGKIPKRVFIGWITRYRKNITC